MKRKPFLQSLSEGRGNCPLPSRTHPQKQNLAVYTEELTHLKVGKHRIQGVSDEFIPPILDLAAMNEVIAVPDGDAIIMAQKLASQLGLGVGISSGCNFLAALRVQEQLGPDSVVVTIFADDNKKYLSSALLSEEPDRVDYLAPHINLVGLSAMGPVCSFCEPVTQTTKQ
jgi:cysteine synthase A